MQIRFHNSPAETSRMNADELRSNFLVQNIMVNDEINFVYSHYDRVIIGGAVPVNKTIVLKTYDCLKATYFLERREIGVINVGGDGEIKVGDKVYNLRKLDCLYIGKGNAKVSFKSKNKKEH